MGHNMQVELKRVNRQVLFFITSFTHFYLFLINFFYLFHNSLLYIDIYYIFNHIYPALASLAKPCFSQLWRARSDPVYPATLNQKAAMVLTSE